MGIRGKVTYPLFTLVIYIVVLCEILMRNMKNGSGGRGRWAWWSWRGGGGHVRRIVIPVKPLL